MLKTPQRKVFNAVGVS